VPLGERLGGGARGEEALARGAPDRGAPSWPGSPAAWAGSDADGRRLRAGATDLVGIGITGVQALAGVGDWAAWARAGVGDLTTGAPVPRDGTFLMGSNTKTFAAVVALQLVGEGRLSLDDTVAHWLPGVVSGNGNDGDRITVRQLLRHTSGL
jgi:D-alanyl-D-alanine carboxypeptidase